MNYHGLRFSADGDTLYAANIGEPGPARAHRRGLRILDVSEIQDRKANPEVPTCRR